MATSPLSPVTRRFVGWLLILTGIFLGLGLVIRLALAAYQYSNGAATAGLGQMAVNIVGLVGSSLLVRYGRRLRRGGDLGDGPAGEIIV